MNVPPVPSRYAWRSSSSANLARSAATLGSPAGGRQSTWMTATPSASSSCGEDLEPDVDHAQRLAEERSRGSSRPRRGASRRELRAQRGARRSARPGRSTGARRPRPPRARRSGRRGPAGSRLGADDGGDDGERPAGRGRGRRAGVADRVGERPRRVRMGGAAEHEITSSTPTSGARAGLADARVARGRDRSSDAAGPP